jgi:hypothetical protein
LPPADNYTRDVLARLNDFVGPGAQWQRRLWNVGLVAALRELREAADAVQAGVLSRAALRGLALSIEQQAAKDPGAGEGHAVLRVRALLRGDLTSGGANYHELIAWTDEIEREYLGRWQRVVGQEGGPGREQLARALGTHLIGEGFSMPFLRRWLSSLTEEGEPLDAPRLVAEALTLSKLPLKQFEVMLVFDKPPPARFSRPSEWRSARDVSAWLSTHGFAARQHGGLQLTIEARDAYAAARQSGDVADRLRARAAVGTRDTLAIRPESFVGGHADPLPPRVSRRAEVRALEREDALLRLDQDGPLDQSLELLSHLNVSPDAVAAAAGWSAVESLLSGPGDEEKFVTADRLAGLVACSWPRAELTTIAWARIYQAGDGADALANELRALKTNRDRADRVLRAVVDAEDLGLTRPAELLAVKRMECLTRSPREQLLAVQRHALGSLRRLYRQRNLVLHGGQTAGFSLATALRLAAPLVGAGLDRLTHAALVDGRHPLEMAARAKLEIHRAGSADAPPLTALLE